jgi:hypothetical protein
MTDSDQTDNEILAFSIEERYSRRFKEEFPYEDCYKLQAQHPELIRSLIPDLDLDLAFIAGYSSSATRLRKRTSEELRNAETELQRSFFDACPRYSMLRASIESGGFSQLSARLRLADDLRRDLIRVIRGFLQN